MRPGGGGGVGDAAHARGAAPRGAQVRRRARRPVARREGGGGRRLPSAGPTVTPLR